MQPQGSSEALALDIVRRLQKGGHVAYYAGGCVRDRLMGREPKDFDVATAARPEEVLKLFPRSQQVGVAFGVVLVRRGEARVEVATFRSDSTYSDGRHPDAVTFTTAEEDARRRDFTCNGLFFDPVAGRLHDLVGGQRDIEARILRAIGDPVQRFTEDHLRMLRAVRFAAKLAFTIEAETFGAIRQLAPQIRTISKERIHDELALILAHAARASAAAQLQSSGLLVQLWPPELLGQSQMTRQWFALAQVPAEADFITALVAMHKDITFCEEAYPDRRPPFACADGGVVADFLRRDLLLSNVETTDLAWLLTQQAMLPKWRTLTKAQLKRLLADPRWPRLEMLYRTFAPDADHLAAFQQSLAAMRAEGVAPEPFITGDTLIALGATPGPAFKKWLEALYDRQLEGELKTPEEALDAARRLVTAGV